MDIDGTLFDECSKNYKAEKNKYVVKTNSTF